MHCVVSCSLFHFCYGSASLHEWFLHFLVMCYLCHLFFDVFLEGGMKGHIEDHVDLMSFCVV